MPTIPEGATVPQDHQPKTETPKVEKVEVDLPDGVDENDEPKFRTVPARRTTVSGITVTVTDEALDDFELLDDFRGLGDSDPSRLPSVLRRMVGDDYKRIMNELRDPVTGRVSASAGTQFVFDVVKAFNPNS